MKGLIRPSTNVVRCEVMAVSKHLWGKKTRLSAPQYVDLLMTYVQKTINDETVFPTKHGEHHDIKI